MSVRDDILAFLREPAAFAASAADPDKWTGALDDVVLPDIVERGGYTLRDAQISAWRGLATKRVGLVLGPPGTGKTFLLSKIVNGWTQARRQEGGGARTLLTAFTRNAIGNLLEAVARDQTHLPVEERARVLFLGNAPQDLRDVEIVRADQDGIAQTLEALSTGSAIVGATIWALNKLVSAASDGNDAAARLFDLICIDEASQMVVSHGLMALAGIAESGRIVVAGDDQQLPPVRSIRDTKLDGRQLGGSLYEFLKSAGVAEFALDETYRLNPPLTLFPESKFYPGRFTSRVPPGADRLKLKADWKTDLSSLSRAALDPDLPVVIAIHDSGGSSTSNAFEADLAARLARELSERLDTPEPNIWADKLAIISPHRAQNALIRRSLPQFLRAGAFVETVDRIQGKERDAVILSYCVSDPEFAAAEGEFIFSKERLNVAITRARFKLIVLVSRQLLDTLSPEQDVVDKSELLREFVYNASRHHGELQTLGPNGKTVSVELLTRGFKDENVAVIIDDHALAKSTSPELTDNLRDTLNAIKDLVASGAYPTAKMWGLQQRLRRDAFRDCVALHRLGLINLEHRMDANRDADAWSARPLGVGRRMWQPDDPKIDDLLITALKRATTEFYSGIRSAFSWMSDDGADLLWPHVERLRQSGALQVEGERDGRRLKLPEGNPAASRQPYAPDNDLSEADYIVLNKLEDIEAARINFGVTEAWTSIAELSRALRIDISQTTASIGRLDAGGHLLAGSEGRLRSRMAELAREVKLVKQRFRYNDADRQPYLVRSIKVELTNRNKPQRDQSMRDAITDLKGQLPPPYGQALEDVRGAISALWNAQDPKLAGFQIRGLQAALRAWVGLGEDTIAIAANTGSGKTEAALLPLIAGALADVRSGIRGTKVVLAYPRIRLATNQAQRLVHYLAACAKLDGGPPLTVGLQTGQVPQSLSGDLSTEAREVWRQEAVGSFFFPFFDCPISDCSSPLLLHLGGGTNSADKLQCTRCAWSFGGWLATKEAIASRPPDFFLPTTDSLHQWMHNPAYGALWGDKAPFSPPRALVADEIHLYTHVHGAQVGMAFQRLMGRCQANDPSHRRPVAIGMSATIGDPAHAWRRLIGRDQALAVQSEPAEVDPNPRGREYFYFVQPEVESRNRDIAGASTTIQTLMCLAHGMRRRTGRDGGYRSLVFFDSIDKMRRLHSAFQDAERNQKLARYRISVFEDDADGTPRPECCRNPEACDRFDDGECWWFAANDSRQWSAQGYRPPEESLVVADRPVFSGTRGKVEDLIKRSDVIFTTSSLEVGYDDPDITLVYQHYAPMNLASFVQRKGRGGRGADDRPTTAVTLSMYSSRDRWWFRNPRDMISPSGFQAPLNPNNFFVLRGQVLTALLDGLAREAAREGRIGNASRPEDTTLLAAGAFVETIFGAGIWDALGVTGVKAFWTAARASSAEQLSGANTLPKLREAFEWCPDFLHDTINLPSMRVNGDNMLPVAKQDISLILPAVAPGNATRRFDGQYVHWRPPSEGQAPWFSEADYAHAVYDDFAPEGEHLVDLLPSEARPQLAGLHERILRPTQVTLQAMGQIKGSNWTGHFACSDPAAPEVRACRAGDVQTVSHDSRGELRGALLVSVQPGKGLSLGTVGGLMARAELYAGKGIKDNEAGLKAARVYWGADSEVRFHAPRNAADPAGVSQVFIHPEDQRPLLHGYSLATEGVRVAVDSTALDQRVTQIVESLKTDAALKKWLSGQFLRYTLESGARGLGVNAYQARRGAELFVSANSDADLAKQFRRLLTFWDEGQLASLFEGIRAKLLASHPMYTKARVERTAAALADQSVQQMLKATITRLADPSEMHGFVRTMILHGLTLRLKQAIAQVGQGDESRLLAHVRLPVQYPGLPEDIITICEAGQKGDGTIRSVAEHWADVLELWSSPFMWDCPNAAEDALLQDFWGTQARAHHADWRTQDRTDQRSLRRILNQLSPEQDVGDSLPARLGRILFDFEEFGGQQFAIYDLARETEGVRIRLAERLGRSPLDWELVSATVAEAGTSSTPELARLLAAYNSLNDDADETDGAARLAEQIYRLSAPLCFDGCRACVHQSSDLMGESLVESSVSRQLLKKFMTLTE